MSEGISQAMNLQQYIAENVGRLVTADNRNKREHYYLVQMMKQLVRYDGAERLEVNCCFKLYSPSTGYARFNVGALKQCEKCHKIIHSNCKHSTHDSECISNSPDVAVPIVIPERYRNSQTQLEKFGLTRK